MNESAKSGSAMVVLSGGQDSTTCLFWALQHFERVYAITFDYGQRHRREIEAAREIAMLAEIDGHEVVRVEDLLLSRSPLVDKAAELETYPDFKTMSDTIGERVELTFVPMRNAFFLVLAANRAVARGCFDLVTGVCQEDNANYPDCRQSFLSALDATINLSLGLDRESGRAFLTHAPLMHRSKKKTIELALQLPGCFSCYAYTHTCYAGTFPPCGACHACVLRAEGFRQANMEDPLLSRARAEQVAR